MTRIRQAITLFYTLIARVYAVLCEPHSIIGHDRIDKSINSISYFLFDARDAQIDNIRVSANYIIVE